VPPAARLAAPAERKQPPDEKPAAAASPAVKPPAGKAPIEKPPVKETPEEQPAKEKPPAAEPAAAAAGKVYGPDCLRSGCHSDLLEKPVVHGPVDAGACNRCHQAIQGEEHAFKLVAEEEQICVACHVIRRDRKVVHKPFEKSSCLACHDPHGGATRELLAAESAGKLCLDCHSIPEEKVVHPPVREGKCATCHVSHQSDQAALLRKPEAEVCAECHGALAKKIAEAKVVHKPVREGCQGCHWAHASPNIKLLLFPYAAGFYAPYDETSYALCFHCHARDLFAEPESKLTGFRNGDRNLHYVHVHGEEKGRTCRVCHDAHASNAPKLMAASVPYGPGGWRLPVGFEPTPTGGKCASGCHATKSYDRGSGTTKAK